MIVVKVMTRTLASTVHQRTMTRSAELQKLTGIASRLGAFVAERHPFALTEALEAFESVARLHATADALGNAFRDELDRRLARRPVPPGISDTTPGVSAEARIRHARAA